MKNFFQKLLKKKDPQNNEAPIPKPIEGDKKSKNSFLDKIKSKFSSQIKNKLGKQAIQGEEIVGVELTPYQIRLAQLNNNKNNTVIILFISFLLAIYHTGIERGIWSRCFEELFKIKKL